MKVECSDDERKEKSLSNNGDNRYLQNVFERHRIVQDRLIKVQLIDKKKSSGGILSRLSEQNPSESRPLTHKSSNNRPKRKTPHLLESSTVSSYAATGTGTSTRKRCSLQISAVSINSLVICIGYIDEESGGEESAPVTSARKRLWN